MSAGAERALKAAVSGGTSSRASIDRTANELAPFGTTVLQVAGSLVHERRCPGAGRVLPDGSIAAVWIPSVDEADGVAFPLARILARRIPEGVGGDGGDVADALSAVLAAGMFSVAQIIAEKAHRAAGGGQAPPPPADPGPAPAEQPAATSSYPVGPFQQVM